MCTTETITPADVNTSGSCNESSLDDLSITALKP